MKKQPNVIFLVVILLLFSASIGILHGRKKGVDPAVIADDMRVILEQQDAIDYLQPYLMSGNIDAVAKAIGEFADPLLVTVVDTILQNKTITLSDRQKVQLLAAILIFDTNKQKQKMIMEHLVHYFSSYPLFTVLVPHYTKAVPRIVSWFQTHNKQQLISWIKKSIQAAIDQDDVEMLSTLYDVGMPFDMVKSSSLLYRVVRENKKPAFVPFLIHQLKADIKYSPDSRYTPLIKAVEQNNIAMVKALLEQGADPDHIVDAKIGNARQVAFERGYAPIELILKKKQ